MCPGIFARVSEEVEGLAFVLGNDCSCTESGTFGREYIGRGYIGVCRYLLGIRRGAGLERVLV